MQPFGTLDLREYLDEDGTSPFAEWFADLDPVTAARITIQLTRMARGNLGNVEPVGAGVLESRLHWGPGHRLYFGRDGDLLVILLAGGTKRHQQRDIADAKARWQAYRQRKRIDREEESWH